LSAGHEPTTGADHEEIDERAALCCAETGGQGQGQAQARQIGHNGGAKARSGNGAAACGPAFNDAPSYRAAEAPIGREVQREALSTMVPDQIERGDAVVIAGDSFAIDDARRIYDSWEAVGQFIARTAVEPQLRAILAGNDADTHKESPSFAGAFKEKSCRLGIKVP
jgi:hypothetical protein